jgi:hypothetical protein
MNCIKCLCILLAGCMLTGCAGGSVGNTITPSAANPTASAPLPSPTAAITAAPPSASPAAQGVVFYNEQYGFSFALPDSWKDFTVVDSKWEGLASNGEQAGKIVAEGPELSIRHPLWTADNPRQDIPILIFTLDEWDSLQKEAFHIGAAPIGPSELNRNSRYVFAQPARYNFAYLTGYEEVETIIKGKPLKPIEPIGFGGYGSLAIPVNV